MSPKPKASAKAGRGAVVHMLDSFAALKRKEEGQHGEFRSKRLVLEAFDSMAEAIDRGGTYVSRVDPPPGSPMATHAPREIPCGSRGHLHLLGKSVEVAGPPTRVVSPTTHCGVNRDSVPLWGRDAWDSMRFPDGRPAPSLLREWSWCPKCWDAYQRSMGRRPGDGRHQSP